MSAVRRLLTWGLVAAVAALGLAAGIDALRGGEPEPLAVTGPATTGETEPAERTLPVAGDDLRRAGVPEGRLVYSDEDCGVHALALPDLAERPVHDLVACQSEGVLFSQLGGVRAECDGGLLRIWAGSPDEPELVARERGCGPAWKPDRSVTFVQDGGIRRFRRCPGDPESAPLLCSKPVLTRADLARQLPEELWRHDLPRIKEHAWLDAERLAVVVQSPTPDELVDYLALLDRGRLVGDPLGPYAELGGIEPSPTGSRVAVFDTERGAVVAIDSAARQIPLALQEGSGLAWSPDEEWVAQATEGGIYVWRADDPSPDLHHIPVVARDLVWTAPPGDDDPAVAAARADLLGAGVPSGSLTYADEQCRSRVLALPLLVVTGSPPGYAGLCRYRAVTGGLVETLGPPRSPDLRDEAECAGGTLSLWRREFGVDEPHLVARARGCGAAWKPDGTVTFIQDGGVRRFVRCPGDEQGTPLRCSEPVLTRAALRRQLPGGPWTVRELNWLDDRRFGAVVRERGFDYLVIVDRGKIVRAPVLGFGKGLEGLRPSPRARFVAAFERGGIFVVDRFGKRVRLPIERGRGIAWSQDEAWVAVAAESGIFVFRADGSGPAPVVLPFPAEDVLWTEP